MPLTFQRDCQARELAEEALDAVRHELRTATATAATAAAACTAGQTMQPTDWTTWLGLNLGSQHRSLARDNSSDRESSCDYYPVRWHTAVAFVAIRFDCRHGGVEQRCDG